MKYVHLLGLLAALPICGCGDKTTEPTNTAAQPDKPVVEAKIVAGQEKEIYPMTMGNEWVYAADSKISNGTNTGETQTEITQKVISVKDIPGGKEGVINVLSEGKTLEMMTWRVTDKGIYQVRGGSGGGAPFTPMQPAILFPVDQHKKFNWQGTGPMLDGLSGTATIQNEVLSAQEIDTAMGRMSGIPITSNVKFKSSKSEGTAKITAWMVPKIGIVRVTTEMVVGNQRLSQVMALKSYRVK